MHIHFEIRTDPDPREDTIHLTALLHQGLTGRVSADAVCREDREPDRNADDEIFARGGDQLLLAPKSRGDGYAARSR